jgi:hypothetical protein
MFGTPSVPLRPHFLIFLFNLNISESLDMISEKLGEMFEGYSADTWGEKFLLMSMGG